MTHDGLAVVPRVARWRSRQLKQAFSRPPSNQRISPFAKSSSSTFFQPAGQLTNWSAYSFQRSLGSPIDRRYRSRYRCSVIWARSGNSSETGWDFWFITPQEGSSIAPNPLALDAHERFQPGHLPRQLRVIRRIHHLADVLVGSRRFLGYSTHGWAANQNSTLGQSLDHVTTMPLAKGLMPAHAAACPMTGGPKSQCHALLCSDQHIRSRSHCPTDQDRLTHGA